MSLRQKSELRLHLGSAHCKAALWRTRWRARCLARVQLFGRSVASLDQAIDALVAAGHRLPTTATLVVEDELVYLAAVPANVDWRQARASAADYFAATTGLGDLLVQASLAPGGRCWLAVAMDATLVKGWREALENRGIELRHLRVGLFEDLDLLCAAESLHDGALVLLRREGASFLTLRAGAITDIGWERCQVDEGADLLARVRAHRQRHERVTPAAQWQVSILPMNADQQAVVAALAMAQGWRLLASADSRSQV